MVDELFGSRVLRYWIGLGTSLKGSNFIFDSVQLLGFKCGGSCIDSPIWINKKAATNPKNDHDKCFQYAAMAALNYTEIKWNPERVSNIKLLINKYNYERIKYASKLELGQTSDFNVL